MGKRGTAVVMAAGLVLALGGCGGGTDEKAGASGEAAAKPAPARAPSRELVTWVGEMCESAVVLKDLRARSTAELKDIRDPDAEIFAQARALGYLSETLTAVETEESDLEELDPPGVPAADRLLGAWRKKVKRAVSQLRAMYPDLGGEDAVSGAAAIDRHVQSLTPPRPDLPALAERDPQLASAYQRAEQCAPGWKPPKEETSSPSPEPSGPLPEAADGKNVAACSDGACEILVTSTADVTANGVNVHITVGNSVTFQTPSTIMNLGGQGGVAQFGDALKVTVVAQNEDGAVLKFAKP
ncbi:hypothetical protein [Streptomyces lomondensis]|uniref:LigA protein n=1 Tax=Streptomyces lomondensis TaxID=68229 RepID=A0ABQ2XGX4_9ACTN|nr:hypothetical protein [Streptomyces lomondensis]MCF0077569.1 hypothetical protein [Streptomyces lomondensis]GGX14241.1 hypothetical protein GCM10010383_50400 [Streptomyces lomondensis]